jgi:hypothetical protein
VSLRLRSLCVEGWLPSIIRYRILLLFAMGYCATPHITSGCMCNECLCVLNVYIRLWVCGEVYEYVWKYACTNVRIRVCIVCILGMCTKDCTGILPPMNSSVVSAGEVFAIAQ